MAEAGPSTGPSAEAADGNASGKADVQPEASSSRPVDDRILKEFFSELKDVDRDNEVNRILWAFKLNPFEKLNLRFDAGPDEVRKAYRKISLMVHPDKCKHPQAAAAFEIIGQAQKELLDEERRGPLCEVLRMARDEVRKERVKETKGDKAIELAALLHADGREGVEAEYETTDAFHERWKLKSRDMIAKAEWRRRKLTKRLKEETERVDDEVKEHRERAKKQRAHEKEWESTRESRVGNWRDYMKTGGAKKSSGQLKPPKQTTFDDDKTFVRRPVGEQHRPPPPKPAGPKGNPPKK